MAPGGSLSMFDFGILTVIPSPIRDDVDCVYFRCDCASEPEYLTVHNWHLRVIKKTTA